MRYAIVLLAFFLTVPSLLANEKPAKPAPMIFVETQFPGASALVLADTVAEPIEKQLDGLEGVVQLASRCNNDGTYLLAISFKPGVNLDQAQVNVQDRVARALPMLPDLVKDGGITVKKKSPVLMIVNLSSPKDRYDTLYLSNYATIQLKDELTRLTGVAAVTLFGTRDYSMRAWLDPQKMAARKLSATDVIDAIRMQNVQVAAGAIGQPPIAKDFKFSITTQGRLKDAKEFEDIIIKNDPTGARVRLKDVGRVELGAQAVNGNVRHNGQASVALGIYPLPDSNAKQTSRAVEQRLAELRKRLPEGLKLDVVFDFAATPADYLLIDVELPPAASAERIDRTLSACDKLLRDVPGVQDLTTFTENPFDIVRNQPCILVRLAPADKRKMSRTEITRAIRAKLANVPDALLRLRHLARAGISRHGYPIDAAVTGPEADKVHALAQAFAGRLQKAKKLTDVWVSRESSPRPQLFIEIDRAKAANLDVAISDIIATMEARLGSVYVNQFNVFGRTWQLNVQLDGKPGGRVRDLKQIQVRNSKCDMVPIGSLVNVKAIDAPATIHRIDLRPAVQVSANPAADVSLLEARGFAASQFEKARKKLRLPADYRLTWLP
ncbi:MAG: efflux RND transporter permease subunit [Planctomycetes bacterium]|nr:efflux RND transporter permease subunit [Planctomycetota bacterium]